MEVSWKTRDVASEFGVNQKKIRKWINYFNLKCEVNESGHFIINRDLYRQLVYIQEQVELGKALNDISFSTMNSSKQPSDRMVSSHQLDKRFNKLLVQIDHLDRKLQGKASDIVEIQMFQHRKEIDELTEELQKFNTKLQDLEQIINEKADKAISLQKRANEMDKGKKKSFAKIFSF